MLKMTQELFLNRNQDYKNFLADIKQRLQHAQIRAALAANVELIKFYWELGCELLERQKNHSWGSKFLEQFSQDIRQEFPEMQGFSVTNLKRMRIFAQEYPNFLISPQAVDQLPWGHICLLIHQIKNPLERSWYIGQIVSNGWSRSILEMQIESNLYHRQAFPGQKITNFATHLPKAQSDLANEILKDPYKFDFLTIQNDAREREVELALITHIKGFLLELGQSFAFVGSQVPLTFDDQEFFIDLLFYHIKLHAYVVIEIKAGKFKPEHTGQLGFYLTAVDEQLRGPQDQKTIGILLCKTKSKIIAEYALRNINAPIGVSEYTLENALPNDLKTKLPSIAEIEEHLNETINPQILSPNPAEL